jgi:D-serine deaminase-like pyridoxal phosphate-dependent protein
VKLLEASPSLMTVVDHAESIELFDRLLTESGIRMDVLVDIDVGLQRTGVPPAGAHIQRYDERKTASLECMRRAAEVFEQLQAKTASCTIFSGAGTGTCEIDLEIAALSELQVGSYPLMDAEYLAIESARHPELADVYPAALTLLATVISASQDTHVTVDAGLKALYRDGGQPQVVTERHRGLRYDWFGDEYGMLSIQDKTTALPRLGEVVELVVSHCDPTVNQFDCYYVTRGSQVTVAFSLAFAADPRMPQAAFFCCQQHAPQYFWRTAYQSHANGADKLLEVIIEKEVGRPYVST